MLQREVADRIVARPGTAEYGVLSVLMQWRADVARLLAIPPGAFRPPPEVRSALIRLTFRPPAVRAEGRRPVRADGAQHVHPAAQDARECPGRVRRRAGVDRAGALAAAGIDPRRRPETLEVIEMARLADIFAAARS